jgi:hypothetical protein
MTSHQCARNPVVSHEPKGICMIQPGRVKTQSQRQGVMATVQMQRLGGKCNRTRWDASTSYTCAQRKACHAVTAIASLVSQVCLTIKAGLIINQQTCCSWPAVCARLCTCMGNSGQRRWLAASFPGTKCLRCGLLGSSASLLHWAYDNDCSQ